MTHTVAVGEFEGPLGLLLELVERNKFEVTNISVADITSQYLDYIRILKHERSPEELSEFLNLGSRLLYIKSLALLPRDAEAESAEELRRLNIELDEYRRFQEAARWLNSCRQQTWERPLSPQLPPQELPWPNLTLDRLAQTFAHALKDAPAPPVVQPPPTHIKLDTIISRIKDQLQQSRLELTVIIRQCLNRTEIVVTFLAILELIREGSASVNQDGQFSPIIIEATHA